VVEEKAPVGTFPNEDEDLLVKVKPVKEAQVEFERLTAKIEASKVQNGEELLKSKYVEDFGSPS
jgi:hypothetical protein